MSTTNMGTEAEKRMQMKEQENLFETRRKAKIWLGVITLLSFITGVLLVGYSGYGIGSGHGKLVMGFGIFLGLCLVIISSIAVYGVCAQSEKALSIFFGIVLVLTLFMFFVVICAFIFTGDVKTYVDGNWQDIQGTFAGKSQDEIVDTIKQNLLAIGCISLFSLIFMISSLIFSARVLGAAKTQSRIMHLVNFITLILGIFIIVIAAITAFINTGQRTIPYILLFIGSAVFCVSFFGYYGAKWNSSGMLLTYTVIVGILTLMLLILGIFCYVNKPKAVEYVADHWQEIADSDSDPDALSHYKGKVSSFFTLLGSAAIGGFIFMLFATIVSFLLAFNIKRGHIVDPSTPAVTKS